MRKAKKINVFHSLVAATAIALVLVASGCSDKDEYQYRKQQRDQQLFKIKAVSGIYQGSLKSAQDGSMIGDMTLTVGPDTNVQNSSDNLTSEVQAAIAGAVHLTGITDGELTYQQGYYDPNSGEFDVNVTVVLPDQTTTRIDIVGTISGKALTGTIQAEGYPSYGGTFSLELNGTAIDTTGMIHGGGLASSLNQNYATPVNSTSTVGMTVSSLGVNPAERILDLISPVHVVQVVVTSGAPGHAQYQVPFPSAHYDSSNGTLSATTMFGDGLTKFPVILNCDRQAQGWSCALEGVVTLNFVAEPGTLSLH